MGKRNSLFFRGCGLLEMREGLEYGSRKKKGIRLMEKAKKLAQQGEITKALDCISKLPKDFKWEIKDLILKARLIMLGEHDIQWSLQDVEKALETALEIDPDNLEALVELGYFYSRVMDDEKKGLAFLKRC